MTATQTGATIVDRLIPAPLEGQIGKAGHDLVLVGAGAVLIAISAMFSVALPDNPVPITGQTFGVLLAAGALGGRRGTAAAAVYVLVGVMGLPAFAEGRGGLGMIASIDDGHLLLGATGGYLVGFVLASALVGLLAQRGWDRRLPAAMAAMVLGNVVIYLVGLPWLQAATGLPFEETIAKGLVPFIVGDTLKILLAGATLPAATWLVGRNRRTDLGSSDGRGG